MYNIPLINIKLKKKIKLKIKNDILYENETLKIVYWFYFIWTLIKCRLHCVVSKKGEGWYFS